MQTPQYQFVIEMFKEDGVTSLGQYPVEVDWEPAREFLRMLGLRQCLADAERRGGDAVIEPVWAETGGEPNAAGARLSDGDLVCAVPIAYFRPLAVEVSGELVEKKLIEDGERFRFKLLGYRQVPEAKKNTGMAFTLKDATPPLHFADASLAELQGASVAREEGAAGEVPIFIPQRVLDEVEQLTLQAGSQETGGILIGHLHRDAAIPEIAVVITAQIPAHHTESKTTKLTFTAETWTAVRAALDLRKSGEMMLGWWHSHPSFAFCKPECPAERRKECALQKPFLSNDDVVLHRTIFPKGYHVALLANNADAGLEFAMFGWCGGTVLRRGFAILGAPQPAPGGDPVFNTETSTEEHDHATQCTQ